jgi:exosortase J
MNRMPARTSPKTLFLPFAGRGSLSPTAAASVVAVLCVLGLTTILSSVRSLWWLWTTDPLKSIGMVIPVVSFLLVLRVWRSLDWELDGSWWGFAILVASAVLVRVRDQSVVEVFIGPWTIYFPPPSLMMFAYGVGLALLFGGMRLVKASAFPLVLLFFVNPVPHIFNTYVDLPLQRASAHVARGFAMALGQPLSPDKLRLMFTPEFGMFIAPGCNGIRGAVTMGLIALIAGYLYRFRWKAHAVVVVCAVLLGYVFNFLRLCVLVLYYIVALHFPSLQDKAENADYVIGGALFFIAVYLLYMVIQRWGAREGVEGGAMTLPRVGTGEMAAVESASFYARAAAMSVLIVLGFVGLHQVMTEPAPSAELRADETALGQFPQNAGGYTLARRWNETLITGALLFHWAEYAPAGGGDHIAVGVAPILGAHDTLVCHTARGEDPLWHAQETIATKASPVNFNASFFNDGSTQFLEATTLCTGTSCGEYSSPQTHFGFVYSKPHPEALLSQSPQRPIPILLRVETIDTTLPAPVARGQLESELSSFLSGVSLDALTQPYRRQ